MYQPDRSQADLEARNGLAEALSPLLQGFVRAPSGSGPAEAIQGLFTRFKRRFAEPVGHWAQDNLAAHRTVVETIFYPFGGPDLLFPLHLFPQAREYILVGAEPCGPWPLAERPDDFALADMVDILRHYLDCSYFVTKDLRSQLTGSSIGGVLPLLIAQIAHAGLPLHRIDPVDGTGIHILFGDRAAPIRLTYFQQDLRDEHWARESPLSRHLGATRRLATFVKSASYLLHEPPFERLRGLLRERTDVLVQDPSGVPYRLLRDWGWHIELHGRFVADIPMFAKYDQSELAAAYGDRGDGPVLPFGIGYLNDAARAGLIVAVPPCRL
ncbi:hypothetical protein [Mesorhizobium sp. B2-8-5]|uniref:hypothetical protein n=1 Tax=Mesorhizobium sp. B2-8-5 TaxID=2589903 RepID=UPI00112D4A5D|nr:hypothetical protein [Mesorhizobium sp. B2-8-5]UCI26878.1 hypothetical protein FJ430_04575 [Mesorhizobium sp. B2-8-5]